MHIKAPERFRPANFPERFELVEPPFKIDIKKKSGARRNGILYERMVVKKLKEVYGYKVIDGLWIKFWNRNAKKSSVCQPDCFIIDIRKGIIFILEFKLSHTSQAWFQLRKLYQPVLKGMFGKNFRYCVVEVVKWFDIKKPFPERFTLIHSLEDIGEIDDQRFYLLIYPGNRHGR